MSGGVRAGVAAFAVALGLLAGVVLGPQAASASEAPPELQWISQFGTASFDIGYAAATDASGAYFAGGVAGTLPGEPGAGGQDAYLRKFDADGNVLWTSQFGTPTTDVAFDVDADASGVYVVGSTAGTFPGQGGAGDWDAFLRRYGADGTVLWTRQFGSSASDQPRGVALDPSGVYVVGRTDGAFPGEMTSGVEDAFLRKYSRDGTVAWTRQFGTPALDRAWSVVTDGSGVYVGGETWGVLPGGTGSGQQDAFLRKYDADGIVLWTSQFGTSSFDAVYGASVGPAGAYVTGVTHGTFTGESRSGPEDAFLRRYAADGTVLWTRQFGSSSGAIGHGVAVDADGATVAGEVGGALPGETGLGSVDAFLRKYAVDGTVRWTRQFGTATADHALGVAVGPLGLYVGGRTLGSLPGETSSGDWDAFAAGLRAADPSGPCPRSQGYWKTHPEAWSVDVLPLGAETYTAPELADLLRTAPRGDASLILAHQLIAARLNVAGGADPAPVVGALAGANDTLREFGGRLPYRVALSSSSGRNMTAIAEVLDAYNNGRLSPGCEGADGGSSSTRARPGVPGEDTSVDGPRASPDEPRTVPWFAGLAFVLIPVAARTWVRRTPTS